MIRIDELRPEIRAAVELAVKSINRAIDAKRQTLSRYRNKKLARKWQEKAQKHLSRAERYSKAGVA